jgi:hypothetical protein
MPRFSLVHPSRLVALGAGLSAMALCAQPLIAQQTADAATVAKAKAIHAKVFSVDTRGHVPSTSTRTANCATKLPRTGGLGRWKKGA